MGKDRRTTELRDGELPLSTTAVRDQASRQAPEHLDVLVVGAGLSGIGAAYRLQQLWRRRPGKRYAILEARDRLGGTWDLFRYPGVRSDSDMFTLSYPFRPWRGEGSLVGGAQILQYLQETAAESGIAGRIRFGTRVVSASWSSQQARWTVETVVGPDATPRTYTCSFLYACAGYYRYDRGHEPDFPGLGDFAGTVVHPQRWPEDLDVAGREVVVVGSGATAVTLVPALAQRGARVTMLQRSPSYVSSLPAVDRTADRLRRRLPARLAHTLIRARNVAYSQGFYQLSRRRPEVAKAMLRRGLLHYLDPAYVAEHFTPTYQPWDQRLCIVPQGDLLKAIRARTAAVVTDTVEHFTPTGVRLGSGRALEADVVVLATGLSLLPIGGITLSVDGEPVRAGGRLAYRGLMLDGVPNLAYCIGYTNASWTLRADLVSRYVCRLLRSMDRHDIAYAVPQSQRVGESRPLLELTSGYVQRSLDLFPKQGARGPWRVRQNYVVDRLVFPRASVRADLRLVRWRDLPSASRGAAPSAVAR